MLMAISNIERPLARDLTTQTRGSQKHVIEPVSFSSTVRNAFVVGIRIVHGVR